MTGMKNKDRYWDCLDQAMDASHGGRTEEALAWLDEALKAVPDGAEAHNGRGEILWDESRIDEAVYEFELAALADPKFVSAHLNRVELLIEEIGEFEQAIVLCDDLLSGRGNLPRMDFATESEIYYLKSKALFYLDDLEGARFLVRRATKTYGDVGVYRSFEGQLSFELGMFDEALHNFERSTSLEPDSPHAFYYLGLVLERFDRSEEANIAFIRANSLDPEHYFLPTEVEESAFEQAVSEALTNLPRSMQAYVDPSLVMVEDFPNPDVLVEGKISPQVFGLFLGAPRSESLFSEIGRSQDRMILFKKNLEKVCRTHPELVDQIELTVRHEVGHYLGLDEDDLARLGLA